MMRSAILAVALMLTGSCAHAPRPTTNADTRTIAQVMIASLMPEEEAPWGYQWNAVSMRVSERVHWHLYGPDSAPLAPGEMMSREGWIDGETWEFLVTAQGTQDRVRHLSFNVNEAFTTEALLEMLRAEGAEVSFAGDDESAMFYYVTVPGREAVQLESRLICEPYESRDPDDCRTVMTLNFELL